MKSVIVPNCLIMTAMICGMKQKLQRRLEFAFECPGFRYFDLLRWGEAEGKTTIEELNNSFQRIMDFPLKVMESEKDW